MKTDVFVEVDHIRCRNLTVTYKKRVTVDKNGCKAQNSKTTVYTSKNKAC